MFFFFSSLPTLNGLTGNISGIRKPTLNVSERAQQKTTATTSTKQNPDRWELTSFCCFCCCYCCCCWCFFLFSYFFSVLSVFVCVLKTEIIRRTDRISVATTLELQLSLARWTVTRTVHSFMFNYCIIIIMIDLW